LQRFGLLVWPVPFFPMWLHRAPLNEVKDTSDPRPAPD
jgi:hypothetical protein